MGFTVEGSGPLILPRKISKTRSKRAKNFDPHKAFAALIEAARIDIGNHFAIDIANGDGIVAELPVAQDAKQRRQVIKRIKTASTRVDALIHFAETDEPRPCVLVAVLPPDVDLSAWATRMMLREEMVDAIGAKRAVQAARDRERDIDPDIDALRALDQVRGRLATIEAFICRADDLVDSVPYVADREQRRRLAHLVEMIIAAAGAARDAVDEGERLAKRAVEGTQR